MFEKGSSSRNVCSEKCGVKAPVSNGFSRCVWFFESSIRGVVERDWLGGEGVGRIKERSDAAPARKLSLPQQRCAWCGLLLTACLVFWSIDKVWIPPGAAGLFYDVQRANLRITLQPTSKVVLLQTSFCLG